MTWIAWILMINHLLESHVLVVGMSQYYLHCILRILTESCCVTVEPVTRLHNYQLIISDKRTGAIGDIAVFD